MTYETTQITMEIPIKMNIFISFLRSLKDITNPNSKSKIAQNNTYNPTEKEEIKLKK
ncbi:hypothetical protein JFU13_19085 [Peribacillus sp. TH24]|nr:hypothetical protein [Peribacillus sp. TH24]